MKTKAKYSEKRQFPRISLPCPLRYLTIPKQGEGYHNATVEDISQGGFRFRTSETIPRRSCLLLDVFLSDASPIRSLATVSWIKPMPGDDGYQVGSKFVEPNPEVENALAHRVPRNN